MGAGQRFNFFLPEGVKSYLTTPTQNGLDTSSMLTYAGLSGSLQSGQGGWLLYEGNQQYMRAIRLVGISGNRYTFDDMVFGMDTLRTAVVAGTAGFKTNLWGTLFGKTGAPLPLQGQGILTADFASGQITATGAVAKHSDMFDVLGTYTATGALAAGSTAFNGTFSVDGEVDYTGDWDGGFFGPQAQEVGSTFIADGTDGSLMSGVVMGRRDDNVAAPLDKLQDLTTTTELRGTYAYSAEYNSNDFSQGILDPVSVTYNPASGKYRFVTSPNAGNPGAGAIDVEFGNADKVSGQSTSSYNVYRTADGNVDASVLNVGPGTNPVIELSYTSMAHIFARRQSGPALLTNEYWVAFGQQTPEVRVPRSGTANYSGVVDGGGYVDGIGNGARVTGTMTAQMNFGNLAVSSVFDLTAKDPNGVASDVDLGSYSATGQVSGGFSAGTNITGGYFGMAGYFYGPNVEEIGGTWRLDIDGPNGAPTPNGVDVNGAFVGKKN